MDFNVLEFAVVFQNMTLELHHSEHYSHLDSSLSTQFSFAFKLGICVKYAEVCRGWPYLCSDRNMCRCFVHV